MLAQCSHHGSAALYLLGREFSALKEARLAREAEFLAQEKGRAETLGLCWPPPPKKPGRPSRKQTYVQELYKHIHLSTLLEDVSLEPPVWWAPGQALTWNADVVMAAAGAQSIPESCADAPVGIDADAETVPGIIEALPSIVDDPCDPPEEVDERPKKVRKSRRCCPWQ
eukprot:809554-Amphidinium_carterae.1